MTVRPRVSVLLPARQAGATLAACLASVRRQSLSDWECVAVDDGSTDDTLALLHATAREDPRFRVLARPHRGLVATLRDGIAACRAPFIARMDADDLMRRDRLKLQYRALERDPGLAAVGSHVRVFPRAHLQHGFREYERWINSILSEEDIRREAFVECPVAHPTLLFRTEALRAAGYRDLGWPEDYDLVLRLLGGGRRIGVVPRRLLAWRDPPSRLSRTSPAYSAERFTACKAAHLASGFLADVETYVLWGYGSTGRTLRRELLDHGKRPSRIVEVHPGRVGRTIHGAPVISPAQLAEQHGERIVVSVAHREPRRRIREALGEMGFRELRDFVCAA